jgi:uncharacterized protein (UPF0371 family)
MPTAFNTKKYVQAQSEEILKRLKTFNKRFYFEIGGKLYADMHASRVLPGYEPDAKLQVLSQIAENLELVYCVSAPDLERGKIYEDTGLPYPKQVFKDLEILKKNNLNVSCVAITIYNGEKKADELKKKLDKLGVKNYVFNRIENYPTNLELIISESGFGQEHQIKFKERLVGITGPGGGSGKFSTCLIQLYHDYKQKHYSHYAKYETFPVWNLPIEHPVNLAYESATADLADENQIDIYYKKKTGVDSVNYNRDIENYALMKELLEKTAPGQTNWLSSPTEMGVNMIKEGLVNDSVVRKAAEKEILRRCGEYKKEHKNGLESEATVKRAEEILKKAGLSS